MAPVVVVEEKIRYFSKSATLGEGALMELREVTEHKTVKGVKGFLYHCIWEGYEPTWEQEALIKPTADKVLNLYWRQATKSQKPDPAPLR